MKTPALPLLAACALLFAPCTTPAAPGDLDVGFDPNANATVLATAVQPDGKIVLGGAFTTVSGVVRNRIAQLNADGTLNAAFNPNANNTVESVAIQLDGKIVVAGRFTTMRGLVRNHIARLNADGSLDTIFDPNVNGTGCKVVLQPDGRVIVAGLFTSVGGVTRNNIARLNTDGTLDMGFNPNADNEVISMALQPDGKIVIGGTFTKLGGVGRQYIARLNADGTRDNSFFPSSNYYVFSTAVQPDGKIVLGGFFTSMGGMTRKYAARLNANGSLDTAFNPDGNYYVLGTSIQTDGAIVLAGFFTNMGGVTRNGLARFNAGGTLDPSFDPNTNFGADGLVGQVDGSILVSGIFTTISGAVRNHIARLENDPVTHSLTAPGSSRIQWLRGGASPEAQFVSFDLSTDGGSTWIPLGAGSRIVGGWERTGLSLPASGYIRASAWIVSGTENCVTGIVQSLSAFPPKVGIIIEQPLFSAIANGGSRTLSSVGVGASSRLTFTIKNTGATNLTGLGSTIDGPDAAMFAVTANPTALVVPNGSTSFTVQFTPTSEGVKTAAVHIASNDAGENPISINITGKGLSSNADLSNLGLSAGSLGPVFDAATTSYTASVPYYAASITVTPTPVIAGSIVTVNGSGVVAGSASSAIRLNIGSNVITTIVTSEDGANTKTYTITLTRAVAVPGNVDLSFNPNVSGFTVFATAVQPDGKILLGGTFSVVGGNARGNVARLGANGLVESSVTFNTVTGANADVFALAVQPDGKIVIGGDFTSVNGLTRNHITRLNANGSVDAGFNTGLDCNGAVYGIALQSNGWIVLAGAFTNVNALLNNHVARVSTTGVLEVPATFDTGTGANGIVDAVAVQPDGKILLAGEFTSFNGQPRNYVARLEANGSVESTAAFNPGTGANGFVYCLAVQADGKIVIGGDFTSVSEQPRGRIARLNADGSLESAATFNTGAGADGLIYCVALQADGKILLGGEFININGQPRNGVARLNVDGSLESTATFNAGSGANGPVYGVTVQADGKVLLGGAFTSVDGQPRNLFARLANDAAAQSLTAPTSARVQWLRGGAAPEVESGTFESSVDGGANWIPLGTGTRIAGGWERTGLSLSGIGQIRARGRAVGGVFGGSGGIVEQTATFDFLTQTPTLAAPVTGSAVVTLANVSFILPEAALTGSVKLTFHDGVTPSVLMLAASQESIGAHTFSFDFTNPAATPQIASGPALSEGTYTVTLSYQDALGNAPANSAAATNVHLGTTPLRAWKLANFGDINAPDLGDTDFDGLVHLAEYALVRSPIAFNAPPAVTRFTYPEGQRLRMFFTRDPTRNDVTIEVQSAASVAGPWTMIATSTLGGVTSGPGYVAGDSATAGVKTVEVRDTVNISAATQRWLRVKVSH